MKYFFSTVTKCSFAIFAERRKRVFLLASRKNNLVGFIGRWRYEHSICHEENYLKILFFVCK
jgi:hypothetical protein